VKTIQSTSRLLTVLLSLLSAVSIGTLLVAEYYSQQSLEADKKQAAATQAARELANGSDVLTSAVRAYAATGDEKYRQAFLAEQYQTRSRERAVAKLRDAGASAVELQLIDDAKGHSDQLINLEQRIFASVPTTQRSTAIDLAYGPEYLASKAVIAQSIDQAVHSIAARTSSELATYTRHAQIAHIISSAAVLLTVLLSLSSLYGFFIKRVVRPLVGITVQARQLLAGNYQAEFSTKNEAVEIVDLAHTLNDYRRLMIQLEEHSGHLQRAHLEQQAILDTATSGIVMLRDAVVLACNRRFGEMIGCEGMPVVGLHASQFLNTEVTPQFVEAVRQVLGKGEVYRLQERVMRLDGGHFLAKISGRAIDSSDPAGGAVWVIDDITAEHEQAEEMARAQALAEQASRAKSEFLANMSHEIRTPLNAVLGFSHLAGRINSDSKVSHYLQRIHDSGEHLLGVVNDILEFSKLEAGKSAIAAEAFSLARAVEQSVDLVREKAADKDLELVVSIDSNVPLSLIGDQFHLAQILINLLSNAVKFTRGGSVLLRVSVLVMDRSAVRLSFCVSDTGIGIPAELQQKLFQPFEQLDASLSRQFEGTGLGLAITKKLVDLMDGSIGVSSVVGQGTQFTVQIPFALDSRPAVAAEVGELSEKSSWLNAHVLLVEDNKINREMAHDLLVLLGLKVSVAGDGMQALQMLNTDVFDLVLMDLHMPIMDGISATAAIRKDNRFTDLPILALTADVLSTNAQRLFDAGIDDLLRKPMDVNELQGKLAKWIGPTQRELRVSAAAAITPAAVSINSDMY
jgi:PAS domain S-box-containing protein